MKSLPRNTILIGDVRRRLAELPDESVDCVVTSPPYYQLRDYQEEAQIGLEDTVEGWVDELRMVLRGVARVLKPTGSTWLNLGDTYSRHSRFGTPRKSLLLGPERLAIWLSRDGWLVRNKVIWAKTNPLPHSATDRLTSSYEVVYFLTRSQQYFFDLDAIRVPHATVNRPRGRSTSYPPEHHSSPLWRQRGGGNRGLARLRAFGGVGHRKGKNPGDVWSVGSSSFQGAHFATFPPGLIDRPILAACPERVCAICGIPYRRVDTNVVASCACPRRSRPGLVLDPFFGAGTVGVVAKRHGRDWLGIEINPSFARLARDRIARDGRPVDGTHEVASTDKPSTPERSEP